MIDRWTLYLLVIPLMAVMLSYYLLLGQNVYFEINDQLDETLFTYVLNAKYLFSGVREYPELLGGVPTGGMMVSAWIFVPLYRIFDTFTAFMIQFAIICATAYLGMYAAVKELTKSSILAFLIGGIFMFLPFQPVYGLSVGGGPMILYAFLLLYRAGSGRSISRGKLIGAYFLILYFALGAHLVLLGYVALGFATVAAVIVLIVDICIEKERLIEVEEMAESAVGQPDIVTVDTRDAHKREGFIGLFGKHKHLYLGVLVLLSMYIIINRELFAELLNPTSEFVSHREEMVVTGSGFASAWDTFLHSGQHAVSLHQYLIIPIVVITIWGLIRYRKLRTEERKNLWILTTILGINVLVAFFVGICESELIVNWRNSVTGFFHYFAAYRVYWIYPTTWYLAAALATNQIRIFAYGKAYALTSRSESKGILQTDDHSHSTDKIELEGSTKPILWQVGAWIVILAVLLPTAWNVRQNSNWILNKSQYKNDCNVGLMSWREYFASDVMALIKDAIGKDQSTYKVASLGICPAVALEAGFYCIDGYSNNYPLEYKHAFREIIAAELEKCPSMKAYFDDWGSRCYLFTEESQNYYYLAKGADFRYDTLELNTSAMKDLGCEYLFAGAEITNAEAMNLNLVGRFSTDESYYEIWVYELQ